MDHLGIQTDNEDELVELKQRARAADMALVDEGEVTCCYARSEKYWLTDPQGIAWEQFHTLGNVPVFSEEKASTAATSGCCVGAAPRGKAVAVAVKSASSCC